MSDAVRSSSKRLQHRLGVFLFFLPFGVLLIGITMSSQVLRGLLAIHAIGPGLAIGIAIIGFFFWAALFGHNILKWWFDRCFSQNEKFRQKRHQQNLLENGPRTVRALYRYGLESLSKKLQQRLYEASWALKSIRKNNKQSMESSVLKQLQDHWRKFNLDTGTHNKPIASAAQQATASTWPYLVWVAGVFALALWYQTSWGWLCLTCTALVCWYMHQTASPPLASPGAQPNEPCFTKANGVIDAIYNPQSQDKNNDKKNDQEKDGKLYRAYFALLLVSHFESLERNLISGQTVKRRQFGLRVLGVFNCFVHASATFWGGYQLLTTIMSPATLVALGFYPNLILVACMFGTGFLAAFALTRVAIYKYYNNEYILPHFTRGCRQLKKRAQEYLNAVEIDGKKIFRTPSSFERIMAGRFGLILAWITAVGFAVFSYQAGLHVLGTMAFMLGLTGPAPLVAMCIGFCWAGATLLASNAFYGYFRQYPMPNTATFSWPHCIIFYLVPCVPACATAIMLFMATVGPSSPWLVVLHHIGFGPAAASWVVWGIASIIGTANITLVYKLFLRGMTLLDDFVMFRPKASALLGFGLVDDQKYEQLNGLGATPENNAPSPTESITRVR